VTARFRAAWETADDAYAAELLPEHLARAAAAVLPVDGAGISLFDGTFRVPLGGSDPTATHAERLQFTQGQGPCLTAALEMRTLVTDRATLEGNWPMFADVLFAQTPYRAVLTVPMVLGPGTRGAVDLFLHDPATLPRVRVADASRVTDQIADALRRVGAAPSITGTFSTDEPSWLESPTAQARTVVWLAMGTVLSRLDVTANDALALLRAYAFANETVVDDVAAAIVDGSIDAERLRP
jgi:hypothetical protein